MYGLLNTVALNRNENATVELADMAKVPLDGRYVSRFMSALNMAFFDFDSSGIRMNLRTLSDTNKEKLFEPLETRMMQFCLLVTTVYEKNGKHFIQWALDTVTADSDQKPTP